MDFVAVAVLAGVGETFLGNAIDGVLQRRVQPVKRHVVLELNASPPLRNALVHQVLQGGDDTIRVQDGRPQTAGEAPDLGVTLSPQFRDGRDTAAAAIGPSGA